MVVPEGREKEWVSFSEDQRGFQESMKKWGVRVGIQGHALSNVAAIALWGDSAVFTKRDSLHLLLFTVLSGPCRRRFWICGFNKKVLCQCGCFGRCTYDSIWAVIAWMFRALLAKQYPACDHTGQAFPPGSQRACLAGKPLRVGGACIAKCGDWQWFKAVLGLRGWRGEGQGKHMCWICSAGFNDHHNCYDFSLNATWRAL